VKYEWNEEQEISEVKFQTYLAITGFL